MIETLMKQLYFRGLRRRVEHLESQRREATPVPSPESTTPPGKWCQSQPAPRLRLAGPHLS